MSDQNDLVLVTGATGNQGGATARHLLHIGRSVRALVRDPESAAAQELAAAGAELVIGDFDEPASLPPALAGVRAVFLIPPASFGVDGWDAELEARRGENFVAAAQAAGVTQIVFSGVASFEEGKKRWGAQGKRRIEEAVRASGVRWTILRPVRFMENYLLRGSQADGIADGVHRHLFVADAPLQMIALTDVAAFAVLTLTDPERFHGQVLELAGDAPTPVAAAALISQSTGHPVRYEEFSEAQAVALGDEIANIWQMTHEGKGWHADIAALREIHPGLRTLPDWLAESGAALLKARLAD